MLPLQGARVGSLVRELRFHKLHSGVKKDKFVFPNLQHQFLLGLNINASHQAPAPEGEAQLSEFQQPSR